MIKIDRGAPFRALAALALAACGAVSTPPDAPRPAVADEAAMSAVHAANLPAIDTVAGPLALTVVYPADGSVIAASDSSFFFGSTGNGRSELDINGMPVRVAPNGAWLAWLPLPRDTVMRFEMRVVAGPDTLRRTLTARRAPRFRPARPLWIDSTSLTPVGSVDWPAGEPLTIQARATPGAQLQLLVGDSVRVPLRAGGDRGEVPWGIRAFDRDTMNLVSRPNEEQYVGVVRGIAITDSSRPRLQLVHGTDTVTVPWPLRVRSVLPARVELNDDTLGSGGTDRIVIGRAWPEATYQWFWPNGTEAVASARVGAATRLDLAPGLHAWVSSSDVRSLTPRWDAPIVGSVTMSSAPDRIVARIPVSRAAPYEVVEGERSLKLLVYGAVGDVNWIRYGAASDLVTALAWHQSPAGVELTFELARPVWGYRTTRSRGDLILEIRRPPEIDRSAPFRGRLIVVDAGHPPGGATGPTGLTEAEANLAIARRLETLLGANGATVVMTRTDDRPVALGERPALADSIGADLLVSIHNNAFPDGVNPFTNNGSSVFYNHPRAVPLARAVQAALVDQLGQRDLGLARGDLALVRPTWMPAVLTEGLFLMVPEQENALRSAEGQQRYAEAVFEGLRSYLRRWSER